MNEWDLVANHTAAELARLVIRERARRRDDQRFADVVVSQRDAAVVAHDAAVVARDAARRDRAALLEARGLQGRDAAAVWDWLLARTGQHRPGQSRGIRELRAEWEREGPR